MSPVVLFIVAAAVIVLAIFLALWLLDARRAKQVEHDPERLEQDPEQRPNSRD